MRKGDGGLGFPNVVDRVNSETVSMIQRMLRGGGEAANAMLALLERSARMSGGGTVEGRLPNERGGSATKTLGEDQGPGPQGREAQRAR